MSLKVVSFFSLQSRPRNWSNQELAEFYRVEASLGRAGIAIETEQGLSDEGDPWFIFCRAETGDVIIHFARIDGDYIVASPAFGSCVRGRDFRTLIEGLMDQYPVVMPREKEKGKFHIHPAALLVALVTTAFFKLYQGDALADETHHDTAAPALPGGGGVGSSGQRATAAAQSQMITLDERSAATLMVAVAVAVAWEQTTGGDDALPTSHEAQAQGLTVSVPSADHAVQVAHASAQDAPTATQDTSTSSVDQTPILSHDTQVALATTVLKPVQQSVEVDGPTAKPVDDSGARTTADPTPMVGQTDHERAAPSFERHTAEAAPVERPAAPQSGDQQHVAGVEGSGSSAAMAEVKTVIGDLLQTHLAANSDSAEQQLMLTLLTNTATHNGSSMVTVAVNLDTETAAVAPAKDVPAESASGASEPTTFTATTTTNAPPAAPSVDTAIHQFMVEHTDFQIIKLDQEVIIYDPSLTPSNVQNAEQETFSFADGSSVMLIGLPHHSAATIGV